MAKRPRNDEPTRPVEVPVEVRTAANALLGVPKELTRAERRERLFHELCCPVCNGRSSCGACVHCSGFTLSPTAVLNKLLDLEIALEQAHKGEPRY